MLAELHSHLYGCLVPDDLRWLAARNRPRWEIFAQAYEQAWNRPAPAYDDLFGARADAERLAECYFFRAAGDFARFQASFALIIAVSSTEPEELHEIVQRVAAREPADHAEYRMLFSPLIAESDFRERVLALAEGAERAERTHPGRAVRIAVSLLRDTGRAEEQYAIVRALVAGDERVARHVTGIDFCHVEEGHPPKGKRELFARALRDNAADPSRALAILYHVGESFVDKSVESAVRWVVEAALAGAHRLGHCLALGLDAGRFADQTRSESVAERIDQLEFELLWAEELGSAGYPIERAAHEGELRSQRLALAQDPNAQVSFHYDTNRLQRLTAFQDWAIERVRRTGAVVESCPSSNTYIGGLANPRQHPLPRFLSAGLPVVVGADDPGILATDLAQEFEIVREQMGIDEHGIETLLACARRSRSEALVRGG